MINQADSIYASEIFRLAESQINKVFYNSSANHAAIVHQALVKYATEYIDIFSSSMCSEISNNDEYCQLVRNYLEKDKKPLINILLTDYRENFKSTPIAQLLAKYPFQVTVKQYNGQVMYKGKPAHFTVMDNKAFRLETDIDNHMAFGNFNSPDQAITLKEFFDKIFQSKLTQNIPLC